MKKPSLVPPGIKVYVTGYYFKNGKKRYGFVRPDARREQTINIKNMETGELFRLSIIAKKQLKRLKKQVGRILSGKIKKFAGKEIVSVVRKIKKNIKIPFGKEFDSKYDKGEYRRSESIQIAESISKLESIFYSAFYQGRQMGAEIIIPSIRISISFSHSRNGSRISKWFIWSRRVDVNIKDSSISELFMQIVKNCFEKIKEINSEYKNIIDKIEYEIKLHWLKPKND